MLFLIDVVKEQSKTLVNQDPTCGVNFDQTWRIPKIKVFAGQYVIYFQLRGYVCLLVCVFSSFNYRYLVALPVLVSAEEENLVLTIMSTVQL